MKYNIADKVHYIGGDVVFGLKEGTDELNVVRLPSVDATYIHHVIGNSSDGDLYIIQHEQGGVKLDFFLENKTFFGDLDLSRLDANKHYAYVPKDDLIMLKKFVLPEKKEPVVDLDESKKDAIAVDEYLENVEDDIPENTQDELEDDIPEDTQDELEDDIPEINNYEQQERPSVINTTHKNITDESTINVNKPRVSVSKPHYHSANIPSTEMSEVVPISQVVMSMKQTESFQVESVMGITQNGRGGDYLILHPDNTLSIEPKESHDNKYMIVNDKSIVRIGEITYVVPPEIREYISGLENLNLELRDKLFLEFPKLMKE